MKRKFTSLAETYKASPFFHITGILLATAVRDFPPNVSESVLNDFFRQNFRFVSESLGIERDKEIIDNMYETFVIADSPHNIQSLISTFYLSYDEIKNALSSLKK